MQLEGINKHRLNEIHVTKENKVYLGYIRGWHIYDAETGYIGPDDTQEL